jgi:GMP synthase-like glutamine amidotransferase
VRDAIRLDIAVIGHCLGGQLLSRALGGTVQAAENVEIGWSDVEVVHAGGAEWLGPEARLPLFQWHGESFSIPSGAQRIATGKHCANQAFLIVNKHLGMQFHCEVDEEKVRDWLETGAAEIRDARSPGVQQPADILPTLNVDLARSQTVASHIYRRWTQGLRG